MATPADLDALGLTIVVVEVGRRGTSTSSRGGVPQEGRLTSTQPTRALGLVVGAGTLPLNVAAHCLAMTRLVRSHIAGVALTAIDVVAGVEDELLYHTVSINVTVATGG